MSQLALPLKLADHAVFDSFLAANNDELYSFLIDITIHGRGPGCFIWGAPSTGRTHLLQAVCERAGDQSAYLPLRDLVSVGVDVLHGLADRSFVCLDDLDRVVGQPEWEGALFRLLNEITDNDSVLVVSSTAPPKDSGIVLADLTSRLSRLPVFHCKVLNESDRIRALQLRAGFRGLDLPDDTANYLLTRSRRDMNSLYQLLDRLDTEAMIAKRRLTIPFVRDVLSNQL